MNLVNFKHDTDADGIGDVCDEERDGTDRR